MDNDLKINDSLKFLTQTSRILSQSLSREDLISLIIRESARLTGADMAALILLEHSGVPREFYAFTKFDENEIALNPKSHNFDSENIQPGLLESIDGSDSWNRFFEQEISRTFKYRLRLPLFYRNKWSGFLDFYNDSENGFRDELYLDHLKSLAASFSLALENAFLNEYAQRKAFENKLLIETSQIMANVLERDEVLVAISEALKLVVDYNGISIYLITESDNLEAIYWKGYQEGDQSRDMLMTKAGEGLVGWVARTGQGVVVDDVEKDDRYICARDTTRSELVVPIKLKDKIIGVFNIESDRQHAFFNHDLDLLNTFAAKSAIAIERASLYRELLMKKQLDQEVSIARSIQQTFLPRQNLKLEGFDIAGLNHSSRQVGGDYYDFIDIEEGQTGLVIADVVGKGVPAALIMASFRASLIAEIRNNYAIRAIMQKVNRLMTESLDGGRFVTAVYGVLDSRSKIFTFSNAGHNPPILLKPNGDVVELTDGGLAFGIDDTVRYEERPIGLHSGDILVFFTDGVTEAQDDKRDQFDNSRLIQAIRDNYDRPASEIVEKIVERVVAFKSQDFILDDLTIMILKVD